MRACTGLLIVAAPHYIVSAGMGGAGSAGLVAGSFGLGLVVANLVAFKLGSVLHPWLMCRGCPSALSVSLSVCMSVCLSRLRC